MFTSAIAIFLKDVRSEIRTRYAVNALIMFVVVTLSVIMFSLVGETLTPAALSGILWVIMFFTAMSGLSRSFVAEEERGTSLTLQLLSRSSSIYLGKLFFNTLLITLLDVFIVGLFLLVMEEYRILQPGLFWLVILLGGVGISAATTIIAAIIAKSSSKGTLFPVLSFPILLPLLLAGITGTKVAVEERVWDDAISSVQMLGAYIVVVITVSYLLFDFVWKD